MMIGIFKLAAGAAIAAGIMTAPAGAVTTVGFVNIFPASGGELAVDPHVGSFEAHLTNLGDGAVKIAFANNLEVPTGSFIGAVHIDDDGFLSRPMVNFGNVGMVNFRARNGAFPQGNKIGFDSDFKYKFSRGSANGVQNGESLGIKFTLAGLFDDFVSAVNMGDVRFGLHIQGLPRGASDSIVSGVSGVSGVIPAPAGALLLLSAFGVAAVAGRRRALAVRA